VIRNPSIRLLRATLATTISLASFNTQKVSVFWGCRVRLKFLRIASLLALLQGAPVLAQDSFSDPAGSGPIVHAVNWLQGTLLGTVATVAAIIAVASVGFLMLTGRMNWRYGATVILGCFILFGAGAIVAGIQSTAAIGS